MNKEEFVKELKKLGINISERQLLQFEQYSVKSLLWIEHLLFV